MTHRTPPARRARRIDTARREPPSDVVAPEDAENIRSWMLAAAARGFIDSVILTHAAARGATHEHAQDRINAATMELARLRAAGWGAPRMDIGLMDQRPAIRFRRTDAGDFRTLTPTLAAHFDLYEGEIRPRHAQAER